MTEMLASCSKLRDRNSTKVQAANVTSIVAIAGVPLEDNSLNVRNPTIIIVILIALYTILSAGLVSWAGIALISKPVKGK
jgi:hypothetical protein